MGLGQRRGGGGGGLGRDRRHARHVIGSPTKTPVTWTGLKAGVKREGRDMSKITRLLVIGASVMALSACTSIQEGLSARRGYYTQNVPDFNQQDIVKFTEHQNRIWNCFVNLAQERSGAVTPGQDCSDVSDGTVKLMDGEYISVVHAGLHYVDIRCDRYMVALTDLERIRRTGSKQLQFGASSSSAILTLLKASEQLISLVPLGFGFLDQTWNNVGQGLLYDLPPDVVRILVEKQQNAYLQGLPSSYKSKPQALRAIQGYAALCLAPAIEAEVKRSVGNAEYKPIDWTKPNGEPPAQNGGGADSGKGSNNQNVANAGSPPKAPQIPADTVPGVEQREPN
jgi:hypothetical protein